MNIQPKHKWLLVGMVAGMIALYVWQMRSPRSNEG